MDDPAGGGLKNFISNVFKLNQDNDVTEEEIISLVAEGNEQGVIEDKEAEMIRNIFGLDEKDAKDIMTHRQEIVAIDGEMTLQQALTFILSESNSRFPVYTDSIDDLKGILNLRDAVQFSMDDANESKTLLELEGLLRPIMYIPETKGIFPLFKDMQREKNHMAIVIDEYGQTAGLVTMEDILEEIVGNIQDEYDEEEELIHKIDENTWMIDGMASIGDVEKATGLELDDDNETINGYLISQLERIPDPGEDAESLTVRTGQCDFTIVEIENNRIKLVRAAVHDEK